MSDTTVVATETVERAPEKTNTPDPRDQEIARLTKAIQDRQKDIAARDAEVARLKKAEEDAKLTEAQRIEAQRRELESRVHDLDRQRLDEAGKATMAEMKLALVADADVSTAEFAETIARKFLKDNPEGDVVAFAKGLKADARWAPLFRGAATAVTISDVQAPGRPQGGTSRTVTASLITDEDRREAEAMFRGNEGRKALFLANLEKARAARTE